MKFMNKLNDIVFPNIYNQLDLHGQSRDMARVAINDFIEDNIKMKNEIIVIVHGIGEGILREETQNTLKNNKNVLYFKQDNYNEGQTLVQLRSDIMQKNGFTLTEILAVVVILGMLMLIVAPNLLNSIQDKKGKVTEAQKQMIEDAANMYIENNNVTNECISFKTLIDAGYLNDDFDNATKEGQLEINITKKDITYIIKNDCS